MPNFRKIKTLPKNIKLQEEELCNSLVWTKKRLEPAIKSLLSKGVISIVSTSSFGQEISFIPGLTGDLLTPDEKALYIRLHNWDLSS